MEKLYLEPNEIYNSTIEKGVQKANASLKYMMVMGMLAGAYVSLGYMLYVRIVGSMSGGIGTLLGAAAFPLGLICILLSGGELVTSNFMAIPLAIFAGRLKPLSFVKNFIVVTIANFLGSLFVAYFMGHIAGLVEGNFLASTIAVAQSKINAGFWECLFSSMGCTWLVGLAVWMCYGAKDFSGKILAIWFPIMSFVMIGFQHLVANMFIIPAAMFAGANISIAQLFMNLGNVFLGNLLGAVLLVSVPNTLVHKNV